MTAPTTNRQNSKPVDAPRNNELDLEVISPFCRSTPTSPETFTLMKGFRPRLPSPVRPTLALPPSSEVRPFSGSSRLENVPSRPAVTRDSFPRTPPSVATGPRSGADLKLALRPAEPLAFGVKADSAPNDCSTEPVAPSFAPSVSSPNREGSSD